jgi:hypothetical protein
VAACFLVVATCFLVVATCFLVVWLLIFWWWHRTRWRGLIDEVLTQSSGAGSKVEKSSAARQTTPGRAFRVVIT